MNFQYSQFNYVQTNENIKMYMYKARSNDIACIRKSIYKILIQ